jgi:hypothetical protein
MAGWHEDFGDEPSIEERIPEGWDDHELIDENGVSEDDHELIDEDDAELAADMILERQELEDFEQADEYFNHYDYNDFGGEG